MKFPRRQFLRLTAGAATAPTLLRSVGAQGYPMRPVRWIVDFPPGGPNDITARIMAEFLSERLHQQFAVENRPGAASNIATESVAKSQPNGYTVMELATVNAINASLYENLNYDFIHDIVLVAGIGQGPAVMEVNPKLPATTVAEFIPYVKANPGKINMGSAGIGTPQHVVGELFKMMTGRQYGACALSWRSAGIDRSHSGPNPSQFRPYPGFDWIHQGRNAAATGGDDGHAYGGVTECAYSRRIRPRLRSRNLARARGASGHASRDHRDTQQRGECHSRRSKAQSRFADLGITPMPMTPSECQRFITDETEKRAKVIKFAGIKPE